MEEDRGIAIVGPAVEEEDGMTAVVAVDIVVVARIEVDGGSARVEEEEAGVVGAGENQEEIRNEAKPAFHRTTTSMRETLKCAITTSYLIKC